MMLILQQDKPGDYVVATGETWTVGQIAEYVFDKLGLKFNPEISEQHKRPSELPFLKGDSSKIRTLGWKPEYTTAQTLDEMIGYWQLKLK